MLPRRFTVTGTPGVPAVYPNGSATGVSIYNGQPLGVVLATTSVTAGIPGQPVTNPASTTTATAESSPLAAAAEAEPEELGAGGIACVVIIAVIAVVIIFAAEMKAPKNNPYADNAAAMSSTHAMSSTGSESAL